MTMVISDSGVQFADASLQSKAVPTPIYGCRAWCTFDGTLTGTNAPSAGGNVTSVTRNSAGNYTVNFTTALPAANSSVSVACNGSGAGGIPYSGVTSISTASVTVVTANGGSYVDSSLVTVIVIR